MPTTKTITNTASNFLDSAFRHFNRTLFQNRLPDCLITMHRKNGAYGYFWTNAYARRRDDGSNGRDIHEIAVNPEHFGKRTEEEILSTLVHEMVHLEQEVFGSPSKNGYHNKEWSTLMKIVGLQPSTTGKPGGAEFGPACSHYVMEDGLFAKQFKIFMSKRKYGIEVQATTMSPTEKKRATAKKKSKTKYSCDSCGTNAWAKPDTDLLCGGCSRETGTAVGMLPAA